MTEGVSPRSTIEDPTLHVCALKPLRDRRDATDQLPFIPVFRRYLHKLPQGKKRMQTKTLHVPLSDVECLTRWVVKGTVPEILKRGEIFQQALERLSEICVSWDDRWDEADMGKIKSMQLQEIIEKRVQLAKKMTNSPAMKCPNFLKHVSHASNIAFFRWVY